MAFSTSLDRPFHYVGDGIVDLLMKDGKDNGFFHENYEVFHTNGQWYILTTDYLHNRQFHDKYDVQAPYLYALERGSRWLKWPSTRRPGRRRFRTLPTNWSTWVA
jgi:hypothetical protein